MFPHGFRGGGTELDLETPGNGGGLEMGHGEAVGENAVGKMERHCG